MADPKNDITTEVTATDQDVAELKKAQYAANPSTRLPPPAQIGKMQTGLVPELVQRLRMGQKTAMFNGIVRCIQIVDPNTPQEHHCMSMIVNNLSANESACTRCTKVQSAGVANPRVTNSASIRLTPEDLKEMGLTEDPLFGKVPQTPAAPAPKKAKKQSAEPRTRRPNMPIPNKVTIQVTMEELKADPNVVRTLLNKTLESIFELPVKNFREAEEIRIVKERVESFLAPEAKQAEEK